MNANELLEAALHVLVAWNTGNEPDPLEVEALRNAVPASTGMEIDELACQIIHREGGRLLEESEQERNTQRLTGDGRVA
jgi:hypothetical protein